MRASRALQVLGFLLSLARGSEVGNSQSGKRRGARGPDPKGGVLVLAAPGPPGPPGPERVLAVVLVGARSGSTTRAPAASPVRRPLLHVLLTTGLMPKPCTLRGAGGKAPCWEGS